MTTVLGSCISVTMFHPATGTASICHAMLPAGRGSDSFKFVDTSISYMVRFFTHLKIARGELEVKLFGGADMFASERPDVTSITVGAQNISAATEYLKKNGLVTTASDVGGRKGRKLVFSTESGIVYIKKMSAEKRIPIG